ncbi:MAG: hypothetical protein WD066_02040 [Planctomycetaceae bacterium]
MPFTFRPAVYRDSTLHELPRPVDVLRWQDAWDFDRFHVPLADGDHTVGHSQQGIDVAIEGRIGTQAGALCASEEEMFDALAALRSALGVGAGDERFELFLYHDAASQTYRKFKSCSTVRFEADLSDPHLFAYSAVIHADDPALHATGPGE